MANFMDTFFSPLIVTFCDIMDEGPGLQAVSLVMVELASEVIVIMINR